ncbi:MAG TPA: rhomboid family intramembrane serine protease [Xanthomonadales bacterium]|nr:rhomboid family intramembrane serine protease [Xanthomonadales bacterium]
MSISITLVLIAITVAISVAGFGNRRVVESLVFSPTWVLRRHDWHRLVSYGFVHADGMHLLFNMLVLWFFGPLVEATLVARIGSAGFVLFYVAALVFSILPSLFRHRNDPGWFSLGASGACCAVLFVFIMLRPWEKLYLFFAIPMPAIVFAVGYVAYTIWADRRKKDRINHSAHLWGAVFGVVFLVALEPRIVPAFLTALAHPRTT